MASSGLKVQINTTIYTVLHNCPDGLMSKHY